MKRALEVRVVLVMCGSLREGRRIARSVVGKRLAACANMGTAAVESVYWWKGKMEKAREFPLTIKTTEGRVKELEKEVKRWHSYDVAEFLVLPVEGGSREYLSWVQNSVK